MSDRNFYGDSEPTRSSVMTSLMDVTGSEECAKELIDAADYVEQLCGPQAVAMANPMPEWIQ